MYKDRLIQLNNILENTGYEIAVSVTYTHAAPYSQSKGGNKFRFFRYLRGFLTVYEEIS
jgi:hypothetical protein